MEQQKEENNNKLEHHTQPASVAHTRATRHANECAERVLHAKAASREWGETQFMFNFILLIYIIIKGSQRTRSVIVQLNEWPIVAHRIRVNSNFLQCAIYWKASKPNKAPSSHSMVQYKGIPTLCRAGLH